MPLPSHPDDHQYDDSDTDHDNSDAGDLYHDCHDDHAARDHHHDDHHHDDHTVAAHDYHHEQHDHHDDAAVVDHPHGVPHPDGEHRLVERQQQRVGPVHQPHAAADRLARGAVLQPAQPAPEPAQLPLARGWDELRHPQRQRPVAELPGHQQPPRQPARGGRDLVEDLPGGRR